LNSVQGLFLLAVAGTHADEGVSSVVGPPATGVHAVFTHTLAGTHAFGSVSAVVGSTVA
jgi:hypothetical protein